MTNTILPPLTLAIGLLATAVKAHGYVQGVVADGTYYQGYRPNFQYLASPPVIPSWSDPLNIDNGYVKDYTSPDIICHLGATPGKTYATVRAGGSIQLQWTNWPVGHLGPVLTYLANCNGNCTNVDKTKLLFNKIEEAGLLQGGTSPGKWAASELVANNNSWTVQIPRDIAPGQYVLRHEIIALQEAMVYGGAQNYPQCVNILVTGSGSNSLQSGTLGTSLYTRDDPGIHIDIYQALNNYTIPGPALIRGAGNSTQPGSNSTTSVLTSSTRTSTSTGSTSSTLSTSSTSSTSSVSSTSSIASSLSSTSSGATISIGFTLSSSSTTRSSLSVAGQGFYSVTTSVIQTTSTSTSTNSDLSTFDTALSTTSSMSSTASDSVNIDATTSTSSSTITTDMSMPTTLQTVTVSDSSVSAGIFLGSVTANVSTTLVRITVTVPGNFADPPSPTNATLTASSFTNATSTPYSFMNSTFSVPYPYPNGTATLPYGTGSAYSTGLGTAYSGSGTITRSTGTGATFVAWAEATTSSASIDNGYKPRRNVRYVKPRQWQI